MNKLMMTLLFGVALYSTIAAQDLPKKIIALNMSAVRTSELDVNADFASGTSRLVPLHGLGYEGQFQAKLRVLPHWYAVGALGSGGYSHSYDLEQDGLSRSTSFRFHQFYTFHLSASLGAEYHRRLTPRLTALAGIHAQNNYYIRQSLGKSVSYIDNNGVSNTLYEAQYSGDNASALGMRTHLGVQWELGKHILLGAGLGAMFSNFDILKGTTFTLLEEGLPVQTGTLSQQYNYLSADLTVGYKF